MSAAMLIWLFFSGFVIAWFAVGHIFLYSVGARRPLYKNPYYKLLQLACWPKLLRMQAQDLREVKRLQAELLEKA